MGYPLEQVRAKFDRGVEHLESLQQAVADYQQSKPTRTENRDDPDYPGYKQLVFRIDRQPPMRLGVIAGNAMQEYRAAFDYLAGILARLRRPTATSPNFPIYTSRTEWTLPKGKKRESARDRYVAALRPDDFTLVERAQPFDAPDHPLARLQRLTNLDKHETVHVAVMGWTDLGLNFDGAAFDLRAGDVQRGQFPKDGAVLVRFRPRPAHPDMEVRLDYTVRVGVRYGDDPNLGRDALAQLGVELVGIIDEFERAIPELRAA